MLKGVKISRRLLVIAVLVIAVILIAAVSFCKTMLNNYVNIRGQHLNKYSYSCGGGMTGGYRRETVKRYDGQALITMESAVWHFQDPKVTEYLTDAAVLDELEAVVRKHKMNFWHNKKFTREFVYDGESGSYHFYFDDADIWFSSQIYPMKYRKKLDDLDRVIEKYKESGEKLPGLVNPKIGEEEYELVPEGELVIYVASYAENELMLRVLNGTDEEVEISSSYKLIDADTDAVLVEEETPYGGSFSGRSNDEMYIRLKERLDAGNYKLIFGDIEIAFEIR